MLNRCVVFICLFHHLVLHKGHAVNVCQNSLTVDPAGAGEHDSRTTFENLDEAFMKIRDSTLDCFNITISPGSYRISEPFHVTSNFAIYGEAPVIISFILDEDEYDINEALYVLKFEAVDYVEIVGVEFSGSPGMIEFENITKIAIKESSFMWFTQGAVDIYQSFYIDISYCNFSHNGPVFILKRQQYRGHAGGLSIGFDDDHYERELVLNDTRYNRSNNGVFIDHCSFLNNTSNPRSRTDPFPNGEIFQAFLFPGRGGALAITINSTFDFDASITNSIVKDNFALSFGGGVFLVFSGYNPHVITVINTQFINNVSPSRSGALSLGYIEGSVNGERVTLSVRDSLFEGNRACFGGGIFLYADRATTRDGELSNDASIVNCTFTNNYGSESGAAASISSQLFLVNTERVSPFLFENCTFNNNDGGRGGVVTTGYLPLSMQGDNYFNNNRGRVLVVIGTRVEVHGGLHFRGNNGNGIDGGAIYITSFSQLELFEGANVTFIDNSGVTGAGLIVNNMAAAALPPAYRYVQFNPLCVLRYQEPSLLPEFWNNINMTLSDNIAHSGSAILMSGLDFCSYPNLKKLETVFRWDFIDFSNNTNTAHASSINSTLWYVETLAVKIAVSTKEIEVYPGQEFEVKFIGYDELNRPTASSIRLSNDNNNYLSFTPSVATSEVIGNDSIQSEAVIQDMLVEEKRIINVESLFTEVTSNDYFNITIVPCPAGYELHSASSTKNSSHNQAAYICHCTTESNLDIRDCRDSTLLIRERMWAAALYHNESNTNSLFTTFCPSDYCQCSNLKNLPLRTCIVAYTKESQNNQCQCDREGVLCGNCKNSTGFSALLNTCVQCEFTNGFIILALIVVDILLIGFLMILKVGPPGWIYPSLFYLQITPYLSDGFPDTFVPLKSIAQYVSSALGFYFVYDFCLWPEMDAILSYFLRYTPFFLTIAIGAIMIAFRYWNKLLRTPCYGLWWLILFQYSHWVHTSMTILNCPTLPDLEDGALSPRWYVNGNIVCFRGWHIGLTVLALVVLAISILILPITIILYSQGYLKKPVWLYISIKASSECFKEEYPWWPAMELIHRLFLIFLAVIHPNIDYHVIIYLGITLVLWSFLQPYRKHIHNCVDMLLNTNALILLIIRNIEEVELLPSVDRNTSLTQDCDEHKILSSVNFRLFPFYYLPIVVFFVSAMVALIMTVKKICERKKRAQISHSDEENTTEVYYQYADATTNYLDTLPRDTVPLSKIVRQLNMQDTRATVPDGGEGTSVVHHRAKTKINLTPKHYQKRKKGGLSLVSYSQYFQQKTFKGDSVSNTMERRKQNTREMLNLSEPIVRTTEL